MTELRRKVFGLAEKNESGTAKSRATEMSTNTDECIY